MNKTPAYKIINVVKVIMLIISGFYSFFIILDSMFQPYETVISLIIMLLIGFVPVLVCHRLLKATEKTTNGYIEICSILFSFMLLLILLVYEFIGIFICGILDSDPPIDPFNKSRYKAISSKMTDETYRIKHFPNEIPKEAKDYYFHLEKSFRGYDIQYLKFRINESYIDKIIDENKDKIAHKLNRNNIDNYYKYVPYRNMNDDIHCTIYILKNENNDDNYTSGIITSKTGEILFFYSNFNLGKM